MSTLGRDEVKKLVTVSTSPAVSIYIPAHQIWNKMSEDIIRFKNQLNEVEENLRSQGFKQKTIDEFLKEAFELLENKDFWNYQNNGLAVFISPDDFFVYKLPIEFKEETVVNKRFYIKPLLPLLSGDGRFLLLALDLNEMKLYEGTRFSLKKLKLPDQSVKSLAEFMNWEEGGKSIQFRTGGTQHVTGAGRSGSKTSIVYGHGSAGMDETTYKEKVSEFLHMAEKGIWERIHGDTAPMVLAGVEYLIPLYRKVSTYSHLIDQAIVKNPEGLNIQELHEESWKLVKHLFEINRQKAYQAYEMYSGNGRASSNIENILKAAYERRVESLFVNKDIRMPGHFDIQEMVVRINGNNGSEDLLDLASVYTFLGNGAVYSVSAEEMPCDKPAAAVFRY